MKRRNIDILLFVVVLLFAVAMVKSQIVPASSQGKEGREGRELSEPYDTPSQGVEGGRGTKGGSHDPSQEGDVTSGMTEAEYLLMVKGGKGTQLLRRFGYTTGYSSEWRLPVWVAWQLTAEHTTGEYKRKGVSYREDDEVAWPKATNADYSGSGYDRGHMCPSGDNKWSSKAQEDCFLFTNMCPQSHNLNGGDWNDLEMKCRTWAKCYGDIYIICGPVFRSSKPDRTIGRNKVWVPDGFYKVVLRTDGAECETIGFYYDNDDGHQPMSYYVRTVDEIEAMTGLDFFSGLRDDWEKRAEAKADLADW